MKLVLSFFLAFLIALSRGGSIGISSEGINPRLARTMLTSDFEGRTMSPWYDQSPARVNWMVEELSSPSESGNPAPVPRSGTRFLRATRNSNLQSGLAVLRSPVFTAEPGDRIEFNYWIRSRQPQGNNLEVYWVNGTREELLIGLSDFSSIANYEWRKATARIPISITAEISLVFYGFCGSSIESAIALDDINFGPSTPTPPPTSTTTQLCGSSTRTTPTVTTTSTARPFTTTSTYPPTTTSRSSITTTSNTRPFTTTSPTFPWTTTSRSSSSSTSTTASSPLEISTPIPTVPPNCNSILTATNGSFYSPNFPGSYTNNLNCQWLIRSAPNTVIYLRFDAFQTENGWDFVTIYDGSSSSSPVLLRTSGTQVPLPVSSSSFVMLVTFTTDNSVVNTGFSASYYSGPLSGSSSPPSTSTTTTLETPTRTSPTSIPSQNIDCNSTLTSPRGSISTPNYPGNYTNNLNCHWLITTEPNTYITLSFGTIAIQNGRDFATVYNGPSTSSPVRLMVTGSPFPLPVSSSSNLMLVTFTSDDSIVMTGFSASYQSDPIVQTTANCTGYLSGPSGQLTSPNYPNSYANNLNCFTYITVSAGRRIRLEFTDFSTELNRDYVVVYDGPSTSSPMVSWTTGTTTPAVFISTGAHVLVQFTTDNGGVARGWRAFYGQV